MKKLEATVAARRRAVEAFRIRYDIVSLERGENQVLAQVRNLSTSLSAAQERVAIAEGKLRALSESAAAGRAVVRARDDPTLANLEQRASQMREELRELERSFTQDYLAMEPKAITQRARLAELERQIKAQREASGQAGLAEAREELASAQAAAARIQSQIATGRQEVGQFTARFNEYKSQQDELGEIETAYRDAVQRRAKLEATERARMPTTKLLEAAATPAATVAPALLEGHRAGRRRFAGAGFAGDVAGGTVQPSGAATDDGPRPAAAGRIAVRSVTAMRFPDRPRRPCPWRHRRRQCCRAAGLSTGTRAATRSSRSSARPTTTAGWRCSCC